MTGKSTSSLLSSIPPSDSISIRVMFEVMLAGQAIEVGGEYTPLPDGKALWKLDWDWDLGNGTLDDVAGLLIPGLGKLPQGIGNIRPGDIRVEYFSDGEQSGLRFAVGDLGFLYLKGAEPATCWGLVYEKPIAIPASGLLADLIGPQLTLSDLRVGSISGRFDESLRDRMIGQLPQARFLLGGEGPSPTGFVAGITITVIGARPITLPFVAARGEKKPEAPVTQEQAGTSKGEKKTPAAGSAADAMRTWFPVDRNIGPLQLGRVGCEWKNGRIGLLLDSAIEAGGLHLGLTGLSVSLPPFDLKPENLELGLDGIDVSYRGGPLSISGAFLRNEIAREDGRSVQYDGMALIKAADFTITGLGSYAFVENEPSLFIFAILHKALGGPVCFRVNGLAAGFGFNRRLKLPPIEEVRNFPLVRASLEEGYLAGTSIREAMSLLQNHISPSPGEYWFAVGVRFSTFEMVLSFALLSVSFGREVEIALLGMARMTIPRDAEPGKAIAYAELVLRAVIRPEEGTIMVEGRLTGESYVFSRDCHLTGGFALYMWFAGAHVGDFVITLGGYHPGFVCPGHYPAVPRLGVNWQVTRELSITSELYYAMTPSCLMAGGKLSAVYQSGSIRAWFIAYADFLLNWKPLFYMIDMGISIGVEARVRIPLGFFTISFSISLHLNVALHLWGPEFAGVIAVDLSLFTLTIRFGPAKSLPQPLTAKEFVASFLPSKQSDGKSCPAPEQVITTRINSGLMREEKQGERTIRVVTAEGFSLTIQSLIPITGFSGLQPHDLPAVPPAIGIRPMGKTGLESSCSVTIDGLAHDRSNTRISLVTSLVPDALWGKSANEGKVPLPARPEANLLPAWVGMRVSFDPIDPTGPLPAMAIEKFALETFSKPIPWDASLQPARSLSAHERKTIETVMDSATVARRNALLAAMKKRKWPCDLNEVNLELLGRAGSACFQAGPEYCRLGEALV